MGCRSVGPDNTVFVPLGCIANLHSGEPMVEPTDVSWALCFPVHLGGHRSSETSGVVRFYSGFRRPPRHSTICAIFRGRERGEAEAWPEFEH